MVCPCCRGPCVKCGTQAKCSLGCAPRFVVVSVFISWPAQTAAGVTMPALTISGTATLTRDANCAYIYIQEGAGGLTVSAPFSQTRINLTPAFDEFGYNISAFADLCLFRGSPAAYVAFPCPYNTNGEPTTSGAANFAPRSYGFISFTDAPNATCFSSGSASMNKEPFSPLSSSGTISIVDAY